MGNPTSRIRMLVLSGIVAFTTTLGTVAGDLPAADPKSVPVKGTVKANSDFAIAFYKKVIEDKENEGKNVFFSPFSISSALAMTTEGARGETAIEMARTMRFPKAARMKGEEPPSIPWRASLIHAGFQQLNTILDRESNNPKAKAIRAQLKDLRTELAKAQKATRAAGGDWEKEQASLREEVKLVEQINDLAQQVDKFELSIANAVWAEKTCAIERPFSDTITKYYGVDAFRNADFKGNHEAERKRINSWVEKKTNNRIKDLIPEPAVRQETRMILVNAIYFKGEWMSPFDQRRTKTIAFTLADGKKVQTPMMHAYNLQGCSYAAFEADGSLFKTPEQVPGFGGEKGPARYPGKDGFAIAALPYKGNELAMVLITPMSNDGLAVIEAKLNSANLSGFLGKLKTRKINAVLPKFRLETSYDLGQGGNTPKGILPAMGMKRAFTNPLDPNGADFSGMHKAVRPQDKLYIGAALHKAFLDVNEKGTEAAAATAISMMAGGGPATVPFVPEFRADRPFLLLIRHNATGTILFMGRVMNPNE